jgi:hypothetical protein
VSRAGSAVRVELVDAERLCHRCGAHLYLTATIPHQGWTNATGYRVTGTREVGLCAACDANNPE